MDPDYDPPYRRTVYTRHPNSTGWFVGIIVALAMLAIAYLVFSANSQPTTVDTPSAVGTATRLEDAAAAKAARDKASAALQVAEEAAAQ